MITLTNRNNGNGHLLAAQAPPHSLEDETAVLCALLTSADAYDAINGKMSPGDLYNKSHRDIAEVLFAMHSRSMPVDLLSVAHELERCGILEEVGGLQKLAALADACPNTVVWNAGYHAERVEKLSRKRQTIYKARELIELASDPTTDIADILANVDFEFAGGLEKFPPMLSMAELRQQSPHLNEPLIEGLLRRGETANIIAKAKAGKSWLTYGLAISVAAGLKWLGAFQCTQGNVLLIDNELHKSTLRHRIPQVGTAMHLQAEEYEPRLTTQSFRGRLQDIYQLEPMFRRIGRDKHDLIILDALYRFEPTAADENSNAARRDIYNQLDRYAEMTGAAFALIHHATKGSQADKDVTDVGAGGGAQSRAADTHLILRPHEEDGCIVLEAAVRSWAPVEPVALRWEFPVWTRADELDPTRLKKPKGRGEANQERLDDEADELVLKVCDDWRSHSEIRRKSGLGDTRASRAVRRLLDSDKLKVETGKRRGNECDVYKQK